MIAVRLRHRGREEPFAYPFYPSGHPATGPTYWEQRVRIIDESDYEVSYADGSRIYDPSAHVAKQCDHCHQRSEEEWRRKEALRRHESATPHPYVHMPSYDEAWRSAWGWAGAGLILLIFLALAAQSIWALVIGEVSFFALGFGLSYAKQTERYDRERRERDALLAPCNEKRAELQAALDELERDPRDKP